MVEEKVQEADIVCYSGCERLHFTRSSMNASEKMPHRYSDYDESFR